MDPEHPDILSVLGMPQKKMEEVVGKEEHTGYVAENG